MTTHDVAPGLPVDRSCDLSDIETGAFDVVTAFDVIEHVPYDQQFLDELARIAAEAVVITTPNAWVWRCGNPHHIREYSPAALLDLICGMPGVYRVDAFASLRNDGSNPALIPGEQFLGIDCPVLGVVAWKNVGLSRQ